MPDIRYENVENTDSTVETESNQGGSCDGWKVLLL